MNAPHSRFKLFNYPNFPALFNFKFLNSTWMASFYLLPFPIKPAFIFVRMSYSNFNIFTWSYSLPLILTTTWPFLEDFTLNGSCCFLHSCMTSQGLDSESNYLLHASSVSHDFIFINKKTKQRNKQKPNKPQSSYYEAHAIWLNHSGFLSLLSPTNIWGNPLIQLKTLALSSHSLSVGNSTMIQGDL